MLATLPLLRDSDFPAIKRADLKTVQVNVGYRCNQSCLHCHVNAGPKREEAMNRETVELVLKYLRQSRVETLDITGGAPELNANFICFHLVRYKHRKFFFFTSTRYQIPPQLRLSNMVIF